MNEATEPDLTTGTSAAEQTAATERELGNLHRVVAETLTSVLKDGEVVKNKEGDPVRVTPSAAYVGAAIAFLKNNNITASPTENAALADLNKVLNRKRRRGLDRKQLDEAGEAFAQMQGQNGMMQ